jgi:hypothetical protein
MARLGCLGEDEVQAGRATDVLLVVDAEAQQEI